MNNKNFLVTIGFLLALLLTACQGKISVKAEDTSSVPQTDKLTRIVPQTVEVTRNVKQQQPCDTPASDAAFVPPEPSAMPLSTTIQVGSSFVQINPNYFEGFIILTKYYTLLDHGIYEESYPLLSSSQQKRYSFEDYKKFYNQALNALEIGGIVPYNYWRVEQGLPAVEIPENELRYVIFMTAFHNGAAWNEGGTPQPDNVTGFQSLVLENNEWKIDEFNTSPWAQ